MTNGTGKQIGGNIPEEQTNQAAESGAPPPTVDPNAPESTAAGDEIQPDRGRLAQALAKLRKPSGDHDRESKSSDRMRALVLLVGGSVACVLLFFALFTTDGASGRKERKSKPSLGRPEQTATTGENANRSPVPELVVNTTQTEESGELTEKDVLGTMRNRGRVTSGATAPTPVPQSGKTLGAISFDDPALVEAYRRQGLTPPPQRTEVTDWNAAIREYQGKQQIATPVVVSAPPMSQGPKADANEALRKSSMVFVRANLLSAQPATRAEDTVSAAGQVTSLPQGSALVARLQYAVSSAAKVPVVAVIEYNYEDNGLLIVPAGTKAYGDLAQATPQGWVTINFSQLEFPNGQREKINGSAIGMDRQMVHGDVNGKKTGIKILTRALTGVGTIAAYAVGGRSANGGIDSSILLRERVASNLGLAGEQQMAALTYQQNIVVTVPARTQFYLVLHDAAGVRSVTDSRQSPTLTSDGSNISDQEMHELLKIRNEMRDMNALMQQNIQAFPRPEPQQQEEK